MITLISLTLIIFSFFNEKHLIVMSLQRKHFYVINDDYTNSFLLNIFALLKRKILHLNGLGKVYGWLIDHKPPCVGIV
jgi:hypothetical protein